jgi:cation diffusion facilitator family transporter
VDKNKASFAIWISLISNILLTCIKILIGFLFRSQVLIADGVHNAGDVIASLVALGSSAVAKKPADDDHPYGHGKSELIGSAVVAVVMVLASIYIAYHSIISFFHPADEASYVALIAAVVSLVWKQWLYVYCMKVGKASNSKSLIATAYDHLGDVYASLAVVAGVGIALLGRQYDIYLLSYGDAAAGVVVAYFILKLAVHIGSEAIDVLMEKTVSVENLRKYEKLILSIPEVKRLDKMRAREFGHYILIDVRVSISGNLTIQEGHNIGRNIKNSIMENHSEVDEVLVHLNPWYKLDS